jgi:dolichol-phosphate mannosyltransferase
MNSRYTSSTEFSLIVPTYCECQNIAILVERVHQSLSRYSYELVVVDDNSPDGTSEIAHSLSQQYPVRVITRRNERGLASAVVEGFKQARGDILGVIDADLQHPPEVMPELLETVMSGADVVIASRYVEGGGSEGWSAIRKIISKGSKLLAQVLLPSVRGIKDPLSGFFLLRREVIDGVELSPTGYKILLEVLVKGKASEIAEVPYIFRVRERGTSNLTSGEGIRYLKHLTRLTGLQEGAIRFVKFGLVGLSGILVNEGLLWLLTENIGLYYLLSAAIAVETAIITNFILNDIWTFRDRRTPGNKSLLGRGLKFNLVSLGGLGINIAILWIITDVVGISYLISNLIGIAGATLWNFTINTLWTWRAKPNSKPVSGS